MVSFDSLKSQAASSFSEAKTSLSDSRARGAGPKTKYIPAGIGSGPIMTAEQRQANSKILNAPPSAHHRPPPPPKRNAALTEDSQEASSSVSSRPPAPAARSPAPSRPAASAPPLPTRKYSGATNAPPAPVPRGTPAPPYAHAVAHDLPSGPAGFTRFSEYTEEDKQEFFLMLDEFFNAKLQSAAPNEEQYSEPVSSPPPVSAATRPSFSSPNPSATSSYRPSPPQSQPPRSVVSNPSAPSYPPPQAHSSSALTILHYILYAPYTSPWFTQPIPTPDPLSSRNDMRFTCSWMQSGVSKSLFGFALFGDCSAAWWKLDWKISEEKSGRLDASRIPKEGRYRPIPTAWDGDRLYEASQLYGQVLVEFARRAVQSRQPVRRGECWDLAAAGLDHIKETRPDLPQPFPSIGRTHGHLIFYGRAGGNGLGTWRGGDAYVRPGDIVEWRTVKIREVGMSAGAYSTLGDPDHTAIITDVGTPPALPEDGQPYAIASLASLTVVEQSLGSLPSEKTYDLSTMERGEAWIYRPVALHEYIGCEISASWPPACETWRIGDLPE